ncbi:MAG: hypothetical protein KAI26_07590 [Nanoarchaeota archaeon]|nr:hypothetical protein [Nanoarchaeota archaeon]
MKRKIWVLVFMLILIGILLGMNVCANEGIKLVKQPDGKWYLFSDNQQVKSKEGNPLYLKTTIFGNVNIHEHKPGFGFDYKVGNVGKDGNIHFTESQSKEMKELEDAKISNSYEQFKTTLDDATKTTIEAPRSLEKSEETRSNVAGVDNKGTVADKSSVNDFAAKESGAVIHTYSDGSGLVLLNGQTLYHISKDGTYEAVAAYSTEYKLSEEYRKALDAQIKTHQPSIKPSILPKQDEATLKIIPERENDNNNLDKDEKQVYVIYKDGKEVNRLDELTGDQKQLLKDEGYTIQEKTVTESKTAESTGSKNFYLVNPETGEKIYNTKSKLEFLNLAVYKNKAKITELNRKEPQNLKIGDFAMQDNTNTLAINSRDISCGKGRTCNTDADGRITKITYISNDKTTKTEELSSDGNLKIVTIASTGQRTVTDLSGKKTLNLGKDASLNDLSKNDFNALWELKNAGGDLDKATLHKDTTLGITTATSGDTRVLSYELDPGKRIFSTQTGFSDGKWSKMDIKTQTGTDKNGNPVYEYSHYGCDGRCVGFADTAVIGDYNAEGRGSDNYHTTWVERNTAEGYSRTDMKWDSETKRYHITSSTVGSITTNLNIYGETSFWGTTILYDADGKELSDADLKQTLTDAQINQLKLDRRKAQHGGDMNWVGDILRQWQTATAGYSGMSLLYDEPDPIIELDETMSALLGGIDGWTSLICKDKMTDSLDSGMAFSSNPNGAYAHVEGEKIIIGHYNESLPSKSQYYKISASVDPGGEDTGCDIKFSLYLKGSGGTLYLYEENGSVAYSSSEKTYELVRGESGISYAGSAMEFFEDERDFDKVCIKFHDLYPEFVSAGEGCLVGVNEGDEICNKLNDLGKTDSFEDPCHNSFGFIMPHCWG